MISIIRMSFKYGSTIKKKIQAAKTITQTMLLNVSFRIGSTKMAKKEREREGGWLVERREKNRVIIGIQQKYRTL